MLNLADRSFRIHYNKRLREIGVPAKACGVCHVVMSLGQFHKCAKSADGRQSKCRDCDRAASAAWRAENVERRREYQREYDARWYAENSERKREYAARYYAENAERKREYSARYYAENSERRREYRVENADRYRELYAQWRAANPDKVRAYAQRRRARKAEATIESFTPADLLAAWESAGIYECHVCGVPFNADDEVHYDHVVALSRGGTHEIANLLPAHALCNTRKQAGDALEAFRRITRDVHGEATLAAREAYIARFA